MKVGILTFHFAINFGAVIQAYALSTTLRQRGYEAEVIDYRPLRVIARQSTGVRTSLIQRPRFNQFLRKFVPLSTKTYWSSRSLKGVLDHYDTFIVGSDQVWNTRVHHYFDASYFLDFVPENKGRLVSYAASFGGEPVPHAHQAELANLINRFHSISVRETEGKRVVSELTGRRAEVVLDPTLLDIDYEPVVRAPSMPYPYIAAYFLEESRGCYALVDVLKRMTGLPVISLGRKWSNADSSFKYIGPSHWLGCMTNASYVCTNSFHGVAISIAARKPFFVCPTSRRFSRITDLLDSLQLRSRIFFDPENLVKTDLSIDYSVAEVLLGQRVQGSLLFLDRSLSQGQQ